MVPSLGAIPDGVMAQFQFSLHTSNPFPIAWRDTYVML